MTRNNKATKKAGVMTSENAVHVFTKPECQPCARTVAALQSAGLSYVAHDITASKRNADASVYLSGVATVPQIFIGGEHVNGSRDLIALKESGRLKALAQAADGSSLMLDALSDSELALGAQDISLTQFIPKADRAGADDPEMWPLLRFYRDWFGFYPNSFLYMNHYPEALKLFVYGHNFSTFAFARRVLTDVEVIGFASCEAAECSYCTTHTIAAGGDKNVAAVADYKQVRDGSGSRDSRFGPHAMALGELSAAASLNTVTPAMIDRVHTTASQGGVLTTVQDEITATALIGATSGFLNNFNDLVNIEIEASWNEVAKTVGVDAGRHSVDRGVSPNLDAIPDDGPAMPEILAKYDALVGDLSAYAEREFGFLPAWIRAWPEQLRGRHAYMYGELMGKRDHSSFPSEFKHLMARVSAIAKGHDYFAAVEAMMAVNVSENKDRTMERVVQCFEAATTTGPDASFPFDDRERAALRIAWLSAQIPITTPRRFIQPALDLFSAEELVQLIVVCALASMVQRFAAIVRPEIEDDVAAFHRSHNLETDTLLLRNPKAGRPLARVLSA